MYNHNFTAPRVLTVSQLNFYLKSLIENDPKLNTVILSGEISNFKHHTSSGHLYLSLKDEKSLIRAVMFAGNARSLKFRPEDGMKVICRGRVSVYSPSGQYQLYIEDMQPDGIGELTLAYEQLKQELSKKGLFDNTHKKPLPKFPKTIGVITSPTGAAVRDILNILSRRYPMADVVMCPVLVQGESAPEQLVNAVKKLDQNNLCDVIILGRGGGSIEDLWAFNSEELAYAVYNCNIPVISAVGHETDFTICDFVADMRAPTPSAAAELAVPDCEELMSSYLSQKQYVSSLADLKLRKATVALNEYERRLKSANIIRQTDYFEKHYIELSAKLKQKMTDKYTKKQRELEQCAARLESLNPISILSRGYSMAETDGKVVTSKSQLAQGKEFTLILSDGKIKAISAGDI